MACILLMKIVLFVYFTWVVEGNKKKICPDPVSIRPCYCSSEKDLKAKLTCDSMTCEDDLWSVIIAANRHHDIFGLKLQSISIQYFPATIFNGTKIQSIEIEDSSVFSLTDHELAFKGLEENLKSLRVDNCSFVNNWEWTHLSSLKQLHELSITSSNLLELSETFYSISHFPIEELTLRDNFIDFIPYRAFEKYTNMKKLILNNNKIPELMRSMLPVPAKKLETIGLSNNRIKRLPINAFRDMPALKYLLLGGNPLHTLDSEIFQPIWPKLRMALFNDSPILCDCKLYWLPNTKHGKKVLMSGKCASPDNLKGKHITDLGPEDFHC